MLNRYTIGAAVFGLLSFAASGHAQTTPGIANVVASCGTPNSTYTAGQNRPLTMDTTGKLCDTGGGGSGGTVVTDPTTLTNTNRGGTLTTGNTAQNAMASNASRKAWCIQNDPAETETLYVRLSGTASSTNADAVLQPGQQACNTPGTVATAAVSVVASDTGHRWFGFEGQ